MPALTDDRIGNAIVAEGGLIERFDPTGRGTAVGRLAFLPHPCVASIGPNVKLDALLRIYAH
jgi:hypothetical protein